MEEDEQSTYYPAVPIGNSGPQQSSNVYQPKPILHPPKFPSIIASKTSYGNNPSKSDEPLFRK